MLTRNNLIKNITENIKNLPIDELDYINRDINKIIELPFISKIDNLDDKICIKLKPIVSIINNDKVITKNIISNIELKYKKIVKNYIKNNGKKIINKILENSLLNITYKFKLYGKYLYIYVTKNNITLNEKNILNDKINNITKIIKERDNIRRIKRDIISLSKYFILNTKIINNLEKKSYTLRDLVKLFNDIKKLKPIIRWNIEELEYIRDDIKSGADSWGESDIVYINNNKARKLKLGNLEKDYNLDIFYKFEKIY